MNRIFALITEKIVLIFNATAKLSRSNPILKQLQNEILIFDQFNLFMTAIFLIFFSILFYQLLIKPALNPTTSPNGNQNYNKTEQNEHLMRMMHNLRNSKGKQKEGSQNIKTQRKNTTNKQTEGFRGGEYIDYEEM